MAGRVVKTRIINREGFFLYITVTSLKLHCFHLEIVYVIPVRINFPQRRESSGRLKNDPGSFCAQFKA